MSLLDLAKISVMSFNGGNSSTGGSRMRRTEDAIRRRTKEGMWLTAGTAVPHHPVAGKYVEKHQLSLASY